MKHICQSKKSTYLLVSMVDCIAIGNYAQGRRDKQGIALKYLFLTILSLFGLKNFSLNAQSCDCTQYLYVNDPALDITHKFPLNAGTGSVESEIESSPGQPWLPANVIKNAHGVVADLNGNLYVAQRNDFFDPAANQFFQLSCDGDILNSSIILNEDATNLVTIDNTIYSIGYDGVNSSEIRAHDLCTGTLLYTYDLADFAWELFKGLDGELYYTYRWNDMSTQAEIHRITPDLSSTTLVVSYTLSDAQDVPFGATQDEFGNFYLVINGHNDINASGVTRVQKYNASGTFQSELTDLSLDGTGFGGAWGITYSQETGKLYVSTLGDDCVAVIDAGGELGTMTYQNALGIAHVPGTYSKAINIVTECCPTVAFLALDTMLCYGGGTEQVFLQNLINCGEGTICGGTWTQTSLDADFAYDDCAQTLDITGEGCVNFTYSSAGTNLCSAYNIAIEICANGPQSAGTGGSTTICETATTPITLVNLLTGQDAGGTWTASGTNPAGGSFNAGAGTFDPSGTIAGTYAFFYTFAANGGCAADVATATVAVISCVDLALQKVVDNTMTPAPFYPGSQVAYTISVYNQGNIGVDAVHIQDYIPTGMTWISGTEGAVMSDDGNTINITNNAAGIFILDTLAPMDQVDFTIVLKINQGFLGTELTNWAEIRAYDTDNNGSTPTIPEVDSTPNAINFSETTETNDLNDDNVIDENGRTGGDEDDHDPARITVIPCPSGNCRGVTVTINNNE